jgi:CubicO group peptidase (beta-lactamase class C family)
MKTQMQSVLAAAAFALFATVAQAAPADLGGALERAMKDKAVPAMAALEIRDGVAGEEAVRGVQVLGEAAPVRPGQRWLLGSDTKAMTAAMIARLVERGTLSWTARLDHMLPDLVAGMRPEYRDVTLLDLMSHRAGLPENLGDEPYFHSLYDDPRSPTQQRLAYIARALAEAPIGPARDKGSYSNTGFLIAGAVAERATGKSYETLMAEEVFGPLGMTSAGFKTSNGPVGHVDGRVALKKFDANPPFLAPAGLAAMSLQDWAKFCIDQLNGAKGHGRLLRAESYKVLQTAQGTSEGAGWALGWGVAPRVVGRKGPALTHSGSDGNWYALVALFPETGNGLLVTANAADSMGGDKAAVAVLREVAATLAEPYVAP